MKPNLINKSSLPKKEDIENFETKFEIKLPNSYKNFLLEYGGGEIDIESKDLYFYSKYNSIIRVLKLFNLKELEKINKKLKFKKLNLLAISDCSRYYDEGEMLFISLFENSFGNILINNSYIDTDYNYEENLILVADSFEEFFTSFEELQEFPFEKLCNNNQTQEAIELIKNGLDVNATNHEGEKLIIIATNQPSPSLELIKTLVENGANVNELDDITEYSPLILSVCGDNPEVVKYLIEKGAYITHIDQISEKTPFEHIEEKIKNNPNKEYLIEMYNILKEAQEKSIK